MLNSLLHPKTTVSLPKNTKEKITNDTILECELVTFIWGKVFMNGTSKICGKQPLTKLKG